MLCPSCHKPMLLVEHHDVEVDWCPACGGCWLDHGELEILLEKAGWSSAVPEPELRGRTGRKSPVTGKAMRQAHFPGIQVELDVCRDTGGIWFDGGELREVVCRLGGNGAGEALGAFFGDLFGKTDLPG